MKTICVKRRGCHEVRVINTVDIGTGDHNPGSTGRR